MAGYLKRAILHRLPLIDSHMKQTILAKQERPLLAYALSKLNPDAFSHPVWIRFGAQASGSPELISDLLKAAERFEGADPGSACQILLLCAVYQKETSRFPDALRTIQRALALAEGANLLNEINWAIWGACSISIQQGNLEQADNRLSDLQFVLNKQNEWILADLIEMLRQSLLQIAACKNRSQLSMANEETVGDLLNIGFDWLYNWGRPVYISDINRNKTSERPATPAAATPTILQSFPPFHHWQVQWHSFLLAVQGELKFQWRKGNLGSTTRHSPFWVSALSWFHHHSPTHKTDSLVEILQPTEKVPILPPVKEDGHHKVAHRKRKAAIKTWKNKPGQYETAASTDIPMAVHMLGPFSLMIGDMVVNLPPSRGLSVLKYLLLHHRQKTSREILMDVFWGEAEPETARNNLNVAMHSLRKALRAVIFLPMIIYENGAYGLDPNLEVWLDVEEFEECIRAGNRFEARGQLTSAVSQYETAISLYQGDLLEQNPYEEWTIHDRERLRVVYLDTIDRLSQIYFKRENYAACITTCQRILSYDPCREDAYCLLMRCYSRQGQGNLALRQYQNCVNALRTELEVDPSPETTKLYNRIRRREQV